MDKKNASKGNPRWWRGCAEVASLCVQLPGADVETGCGQDAPLHAAARSGGADIVDLLLDFGADRWSRNAEGKTPLDLSPPNSNVKLVLQKRGTVADVHMHLPLAQAPDSRITGPICPRPPRSQLPVAALPVLHPPAPGPEPPPQSLQPLPSPQHGGFPAAPLTVASLHHPGCVHSPQAERDRCFYSALVVSCQCSFVNDD